MATQKKTLLELMVEAGIKWPEGAEYAAQDKEDSKVFFYKSKPTRPSTWDRWHFSGLVTDCSSQLPELCRNWHQTIVTRENYEAAVADKANVDDTANTELRFFERLNRSIPPSNTIEQRIAELQVMERNLDEFRAKLTDDLHALGITWLDGAVVADEPKQPVITDWRDLKVGDVIWWEGDSKHDCGEYTVKGIESEDYAGDCAIHLACGEWVDVQTEEWRFIRRP